MGEQGDDSSKDGDSGLAASLAGAAAGRETADTYLSEQTRLVRLQIAREEKEERLRNWAQFVEYSSAVLKLAFEFVVALIVIGIGVALGAAVWSAAHDRGLVIEAFSVPPDLDQHGLTGEVVAGKVLDQLSALQSQTASNRAASSYVNNWGADIKVQIPETGVSIGQLYHYLAGWLGHETHISGEVYRDAAGLAVTARVAGAPAITVHGSDADLEKLIHQAAEAVYRRTQPYRYAVYLDSHGRVAEATAIYRTLIASGSTDDRAWAYIGLSAERAVVADFDGATPLLRKAIAIKPSILLIYNNLANNEASLQHDEQALLYARQVVAMAQNGDSDSSMSDDDILIATLLNKSSVAQALGDMAGAMRYDRQIEAAPDENGSMNNARQSDVGLCAALHDRACYDTALDALAPSTDPLAVMQRSVVIQQADLFFENWADAVARGRPIIAMLNALPAGAFFIRTAVNPILATAYAQTGDFATASKVIDQTPLDCVVGLRARGRIAALAHRWGAANYWFARAVAATPSTPAPLSDWGEALLWKGDFDGAIAKLSAATRLGPHFAQAYELWGEALIAKNRSDLALAQFAAAARETPNWGRLHLKWGEALLWLGRKDAAHAQFAMAAGLFLTPRERTELAGDIAHP